MFAPFADSLFCRRKLILSYSAERANKILGYVFPGCSCRNACVRLAVFGIVNVSANVANIFHSDLLLFKFGFIRIFSITQNC